MKFWSLPVVFFVGDLLLEFSLSRQAELNEQVKVNVSCVQGAPFKLSLGFISCFVALTRCPTEANKSLFSKWPRFVITTTLNQLLQPQHWHTPQSLWFLMH